MTILIITTGGTIGALPYQNPSQPPAHALMIRDSIDRVATTLLHPPFDRYDAVMASFEARDSNFIDDDYRQKLWRAIHEAKEDHVLITHGTDTLVATADYLAEREVSKPVVITGAMTPLLNGPESDGYRNLEFALDWLSADPSPGIHIVLHDNVAGLWQPRLYTHAPGRYEKFYDSDGRYHRLRDITQK